MRLLKPKEALLSNWGDKAEAMACNAEVRVYDPASEWACYILALNPHDEDEIACIINGFNVEFCHWSLQDLLATFNEHGELMQLDTIFKPVWAAELYKTLKRRHKWTAQE